MPRLAFPALALLLAATTAPSQAQAEVKQPSAQQLRDLPDAPKVGDRMPDFSLADQNGKLVSFQVTTHLARIRAQAPVHAVQVWTLF